MRTITCKKCGTIIDAELGECPNCGAMYYILPQDGAPAREVPPLDVSLARDEELFNTTSWKTFPVEPPQEDIDATRAFQTTPPPTLNRQPSSPRSQPQPQPRTRQVQTRQATSPHQRGMTLKTKRMIVAAVALLAVLVLVIALMSDAFDFNKNDERINMPDLVGTYTVESATAMLSGLGLEVETTTAYDARPEGTVIAQSIKANAKIKPGDKITLTISLGPNESTSPLPTEQATVPSLVGKTLDQAIYELGLAGLICQPGEPQYSAERAEGLVISQNPAHGSVINKGDMVVIIVSKGVEPSPSPPSFKITITAGAGGVVTPKGLVSVTEGEDLTVFIIPNEGYAVREVKVDGVDVGPVTDFAFNGVSGDHTVYVVFMQKTEEPSPSPILPPEPPSTVPDPSAPV